MARDCCPVLEGVLQQLLAIPPGQSLQETPPGSIQHRMACNFWGGE